MGTQRVGGNRVGEFKGEHIGCWGGGRGGRELMGTCWAGGGVSESRGLGAQMPRVVRFYPNPLLCLVAVYCLTARTGVILVGTE